MYEKVYHWLNLSFAIVIPLLLLLFMSIVICYQLVYRQSMATRYSEQKRCINRITFSTTIVHMIFEIPYVLVFAVAALGKFELGSGIARGILSSFLRVVHDSIKPPVWAPRFVAKFV